MRRSISRALSQELKAAHEDTEGEDDDEYQPDPRQDKFDRKSKEKGKIVEDEEIEIGKVLAYKILYSLYRIHIISAGFLKRLVLPRPFA